MDVLHTHTVRAEGWCAPRGTSVPVTLGSRASFGSVGAVRDDGSPCESAWSGALCSTTNSGVVCDKD